MKKVLIACEESQAVTIAMRELGIQAYSCDLEDQSGGHPEWHLKQDVTPLLKEHWDLIVAFPPCTDLAISGARWFEEKRKNGKQQKAIDFFMQFTKANSSRIAIENPVSIMSTVWRKPDQIIQPYQFGDPFSKRTCLWLLNLPELIPTNEVIPGDRVKYPSGMSLPKWYTNLSKKDRSKVRSKTFPGIARAMAEQWGKLL